MQVNKNNNIVFAQLNCGNFDKYSLDGFILNQKVTRCWRKVDGFYKLQPVSYTEEWSLAERRKMADKIINGINNGSAAFAAVTDDTVIGFALLCGGLFGSGSQYTDLAEFYISEPYRRNGIGKKLFEAACCEAKKRGAKKIYISAHSAEESIAAYKKYGCVLAAEPDVAHILKEPFDLQLEYDLSVRIYKVEDKEKYMDLLLLADEQREMIEKYLGDSETYVIDDCGVKGEITVKDAGGKILEIKNLAVATAYQRCGYGRKLVDFVCNKYGGIYEYLQVGTGESPLTLPFYKKCGFTYSHTVKNFFTDNYDHPIWEAGVRLRDMVYLVKKI